jgi:hypothetical protein
VHVILGHFIPRFKEGVMTNKAFRDKADEDVLVEWLCCPGLYDMAYNNKVSESTLKRRLTKISSRFKGMGRSSRIVLKSLLSGDSTVQELMYLASVLSRRDLDNILDSLENRGLLRVVSLDDRVRVVLAPEVLALKHRFE